MPLRLALFCLACLAPVTILCSGCGNSGIVSESAAGAGVLSDGSAAWQLQIADGALQVTPYHGALLPESPVLKDRVTGVTYMLSLTPTDELSWQTTSSGAGVDALSITDRVTGAQHSLTFEDGALTY